MGRRRGASEEERIREWVKDGERLRDERGS
jgi:hypothetical protein